MPWARVFLQRPRVLILDEATSALDNVSEKKIQAELEKLHAETGMTVIALAHRLPRCKTATPFW